MITGNKGGDAQVSADASSNEQPENSLEAFPPKRKKSPSPQNCREFIRRQAANAMPEIVRTFVKKAKDGSVPHFTSLAKVGGFDQKPSAADAPRRQRRSLARQLLDEVERYEAQQAAELAEANQAALLLDGQNDSRSDNGKPQERS